MSNDDVSMVFKLYQRYSGGIVRRPEIAEKLAEALISGMYGDAEVAAQKPLRVVDEGDRWRIEGSRNKDHSQEGLGPIMMAIGKMDGRILDFNHECYDRIDPEVARAIEESRKSDE